ncbi:MAG: DUF2934 domain-containing protein [Syntrophales bacterium]
MDRKPDLKDEIARVAYEIYEQRSIPGMEEENWLEAERIVMERLQTLEHSKVASKLVPSKKKGGTTKKKEMPRTRV